MKTAPREINRIRAEGAAWKIWDAYGFEHPRNIPLMSRDAVAYHLNATDSGDFSEVEVPFEAWFLRYEHTHLPSLTEQSKFLAAAGGTLTLLAVAD